MNKEQLAGTEALISCIVTGLTRQLDGVKWTKSDNSIIESGQDDFIIVEGEFDISNSSQTTTLNVPAAHNYHDTTYKCLITSVEHGVTDKSTIVNLKTFSEFKFQ